MLLSIMQDGGLILILVKYRQSLQRLRERIQKQPISIFSCMHGLESASFKYQPTYIHVKSLWINIFADIVGSV